MREHAMEPYGALCTRLGDHMAPNGVEAAGPHGELSPCSFLTTQAGQALRDLPGPTAPGPLSLCHPPAEPRNSDAHRSLGTS